MRRKDGARFIIWRKFSLTRLTVSPVIKIIVSTQIQDVFKIKVPPVESFLMKIFNFRVVAKRAIKKWD